MKLIHDCVRDVLLYIEENLTYNGSINAKSIKTNYSVEDVLYTCDKLFEAKFIQMHKDITGGVIIGEITYNGHQLLDSIRDDGIWKETKSKVSKIASVSLPIIQQVAAAIITTKLGY